MISVRAIQALWYLWRERVRVRQKLVDAPLGKAALREHEEKFLFALRSQARGLLASYAVDLVEEAISVTAIKLLRQLDLDEPPIFRTGVLYQKVELPGQEDLASLLPRYRSYLATALRNAAVDASRRAGRKPEAGGPSAGESGAPPPPSDEEVELLHEALSKGTSWPPTPSQKTGLQELVELSSGRVRRDDLLNAELKRGGGSPDQARDRMNQRFSRARRKLQKGIGRLLARGAITATQAARLRTIIFAYLGGLLWAPRRKPVSGDRDPRSGGRDGRSN